MPLFKVSVAACALMMSTGCGLLGRKSLPAPPQGGVGNNGCLNNSSDLVGRYVSGKMSQSEWKGAFDCINQSLGFFTDYVRGSSENAYSTGDMYNLVKGFLITNRTVHPELMLGAFSLKSALFGGSDKEFTKEEIALLKTSLDRLQGITADLIPYLNLRQNGNPSNAELIEMVAAFKRAGDQLGDFVGSLPVGALSSDALNSLITELTASLNLPAFDNLSDKVFLAKWLMFNSRRDAIENQDWAQIFRSAMGLGGIMLAYKTAIGDDPLSPRANVADRIMNDYAFRDFLWELALQAKPYIENSLELHNGLTPLPIFDHLIDELPASIIGSIPPRVMKSALRPLIRKLMFSTTQSGVDQGVIDTVYGLIHEIFLDLGQLDRMYEKLGLDRENITKQQLSQALDTYGQSLSNADEVKRFNATKAKLLTYQPLFRKRQGPKGDIYVIKYGPGVGYTHFQNTLVLVLDRVGRHIQKSYASGGDYFVDSDLSAFFKDYSEILFAVKIVDTTVPNFGPKRLQDMDLFTNASDGNGQGSIEELVNYAMILISSGSLTDQMRAEITPVCDSGLGEDIMGWTQVSAPCFRSQFHDRLDYWIDQDFPRLSAYWKTLSPGQKKKAAIWLEHGSRRDGYTEEDFGKFDFGALAVILYYTESLFTRFDLDSNEGLAKTEVNNAYPIFKNLIRKTASQKGLNTGSDYLLKGIFSYIVKYQEMPATPANVANIAKLAWWMATYYIPTTDYHTDRYGIFNIVCQIAAPENPGQAPATTAVCAP